MVEGRFLVGTGICVPIILIGAFLCAQELLVYDFLELDHIDGCVSVEFLVLKSRIFAEFGWSGGGCNGRLDGV